MIDVDESNELTEVKMAQAVDRNSTEWLRLVPMARILDVHPDTLGRKWRYGELPDGAVKREGKTLLFNRPMLENVKNGA